MSFKNPPDSITVPDGATTGPRIVIGQEMPAVLASFNADFTFTNVMLFYYNDTDFQFIATAKYNNPTPNVWGVYLQGSYDTFNGVKLDLYEQSPPGVGPMRILLGDETYNSVRLTHETQKTDWKFGPQTQVFMPNAAELGWQVETAGASAAGIASSAGAEVVVPIVSWAPIPTGTFVGGRIYRVDWNFAARCSGATLDYVNGIMRVRAIDAAGGPVVCRQFVDAQSATNDGKTGYGFIVANASYTGRFNLSITRNGGLGTNIDILGTVAEKMGVVITDMGLYNNANVGLQNLCTFYN